MPQHAVRACIEGIFSHAALPCATQQNLCQRLRATYALKAEVCSSQAEQFRAFGEATLAASAIRQGLEHCSQGMATGER